MSSARFIPREDRMLACGRADDPRVAEASRKLVEMIEELVDSAHDRTIVFSQIRELVEESVRSARRSRVKATLLKLLPRGQ